MILVAVQTVHQCGESGDMVGGVLAQSMSVCFAPLATSGTLLLSQALLCDTVGWIVTIFSESQDQPIEDVCVPWNVAPSLI